jgi:hypothetical protein
MRNQGGYSPRVAGYFKYAAIFAMVPNEAKAIRALCMTLSECIS